MNRLEMKGMLAQLREQQQKLRAQARNCCDTVGRKVNTALVADIDELDIPGAAAEMDQLVVLHGEILALNGRISRLEKELFD